MVYISQRLYSQNQKRRFIHSFALPFMGRKRSDMLIGALRYYRGCGCGCGCGGVRGLQSIISDLRLLGPNIKLRTLRGLWSFITLQMNNTEEERMGAQGWDEFVILVRYVESNNGNFSPPKRAATGNAAAMSYMISLLRRFSSCQFSWMHGPIF